MRPTATTYALGALVLVSVAAMYVLSFVLGSEPLPLIAVLCMSVFAVVGAVVALRTSLPVRPPRAGDAVAGCIGADATLFLAREMGVPQLVAGALVAVAFGVAALPGGPLDALAAGAGYTGAFVGLLTPDITLSWYWVVIAGTAAGVLWSVIAPSVLRGVGGRMGVVGFMASAGIYAVADLLGDEHNATLLPQVNGLAHAAAVPVGAAAAMITWTLINRAGWGFNLASGLPALAVCGVIAMSGMGAEGVVLATAFFGGTIVGGAAPDRVPSAAWMMLAGALYGALMLHFEGPLQGHVGVVGVTGTIACLAVIGLEKAMSMGASALDTRRRVAA